MSCAKGAWSTSENAPRKHFFLLSFADKKSSFRWTEGNVPRGFQRHIYEWTRVDQFEHFLVLFSTWKYSHTFRLSRRMSPEFVKPYLMLSLKWQKWEYKEIDKLILVLWIAWDIQWALLGMCPVSVMAKQVASRVFKGEHSSGKNGALWPRPSPWPFNHQTLRCDLFPYCRCVVCLWPVTALGCDLYWPYAVLQRLTHDLGKFDLDLLNPHKATETKCDRDREKNCDERNRIASCHGKIDARGKLRTFLTCYVIRFTTCHVFTTSRPNKQIDWTLFIFYNVISKSAYRCMFIRYYTDILW